MAQSRTTEYRRTKKALCNFIRLTEDDSKDLNSKPAVDQNEQPVKDDAAGDEWSDASEYLEMEQGGNNEEHDDTVSSNASDNDEHENTESRDDILHSEEPRACRALADWAVRYNISHAALLALLAILNVLGLAVPLDPRTLLRTPKSNKVVKMGSGEYFYFGIARGLKQVFKQLGPLMREVRLKVNIDGLPLFKSTSTVLWPILGMVKCGTERVITIAVFCGTEKPPLAEFLKDFTRECLELFQTGIAHAGQNIPFGVSCFICDAPARAFLKGIKGHGGYHACERCTQTGVYISGRMTYPECDAPQRTRDSFQAMSDADHHRVESPLTSLGIDMVKDFTLDYMHLCCLGVTKLMIRLWMCGPLAVRMSATVAHKVSGRLSSMSVGFPKEFARRPRGIYDFRLWKATEFRTFMLYTGPIVLKGAVSEDMYNLFLCFSSAMTILLCPKLATRYAGFAKDLLCVFVKNFAKLFGSQFVVYNVHSLIHLSEDAELHGALDNVSCFPFENYLYSMKKLVRRPNSPLTQIINRLGEHDRVENKPHKHSDTADTIGKMHTNGPVPPSVTRDVTLTQHRHVQCKFFVSAKDGDNCFLLEDSAVILVRNVIQISGNVFVVASKFTECRPFYTHPFSSDRIGIFVVSSLAQKLELVPIGALKSGRKCVKASLLDNDHVVIPILHD